MHDEFLHRLRKEPRPEFAARLQARLRRQSTSPLRPAAPSRVRTLLALLLLGGTAFAITSVAMRGLPASFLELYQHAGAWIRAGHRGTPAGQVVNQGFGPGLGWDASGSSSPPGTALRGGTAHSAASRTSTQAAATSAGSAGGSPSVGAPGWQIPPIKAVSSWAAYPYAAGDLGNVNRPRAANGMTLAPHIELSVRDSDLWPGPMCSGAAGAPDLAYAFEPAGAVSEKPCPREASGKPSSVIAIPFGYETVILARSPLYGALDLTRQQIFLALAKWVPDPARAGAIHENASTTWRQIDVALGQEPIEFIGPPLSSAAGRSMIELLMEGGCNTFPWIAALESTDPARYTRICRTMRTDGIYVEVSGSDPSKLLAEPNAVGIIGSQWIFGPRGTSEVPHLDGLVVSKLDGVEPTRQGIESGAYPGSRGFYLYVNRGHVTPYVMYSLLQDMLLPGVDWALVPPSQPGVRAAYDEVMGP